jgi:hydroxymethylpyrimidine/phosphomethylpyrimidine kinase
MNKTVMAISLMDSSGSSGLPVDLKVLHAFRVYGAAVVTGIAAQNTRGVQSITPVSMEIVGQQIEAVASDMPVHGVKVGVLLNASNAKIVASLLRALELEKMLVVDPVIHASTGEQLLEPEALAVLKETLIPMAQVATPDCEEAEALSGIEVKDVQAAREAAKIIHEMGCKNVIITSIGRGGPRSMDLWFDGNNFHVFDAPRLVTNNTLGVGGTFSAIIAAQLVKGMALGEAVDRAKKYISKAVQHPFSIGKGRGPLNHTVPI